MTAITLRNIPPKLQEVIRKRADRDGLSLNKTVIRMLEEAAGQRATTGRELHHDLDHLAGTWSDEEPRPSTPLWLSSAEEARTWEVRPSQVIAPPPGFG